MQPLKVTATDLDRALASTRDAAGRVGSALFELDTHRDRRAAETARLRGTSAARWVEARDQIELLWVWYRSVSEALDSLQTRRKAARLRTATVAELWAELHGPLVELTPDSLEKARRSIPEASGLMSPAPLASILSVMTSAFDRAAESVTALFAAQDVILPCLMEIESRLGAIEAQASSIKMLAPRKIVDIRTRVHGLRSDLLEDPLSIDPDTVRAITFETDRLAADMQSSVAAANQFAETVALLETVLGERNSAIMAARPRAEEVKRKITQCSPATLDLDGLDRTAEVLREEIGALRAVAQENAQAALERAGELAGQLSQLALDTQDIADAAQQQMEARRELRGRLDAYRAKAQAVGRAEDMRLDGLFRAAHEALYSAPCDLAQAEQLVIVYQTAMADTLMEDRLS
jgi:hypothetical protein